MDFIEFKKKFEQIKMVEEPNSVSSKPLVSVCVQTYQHANFIKQCLDSILMQETDFEFEILLGEDDSNDGTREICKEYAAKHPEKIRLFLHHRANNISIGGAPTGRFNFATNLFTARGKYIAFCEGDDFWTDPLKLKKQVGFLESNPEFVITYHDAKIISASGDIINKSKTKDSNKIDFSSLKLQKGAQVLTLSMCFRNVITHYPSEFFKVLNGDSFLISILGEYGQGKYLDNILPASYRVQEGGMWSTINSEKVSVHQAVTYFQLMIYYKRIGNQDISNYYKFRLRNAHLSLIKHSSKKMKVTNIYSNSQQVFRYSELKKRSTLNLILKSIIKGLFKNNF